MLEIVEKPAGGFSMKVEDLMLLAQLVDSIYEEEKNFESAYNKQDKKRFDLSKKAILDFQNKINFLLKKQ